MYYTDIFSKTDPVQKSLEVIKIEKNLKADLRMISSAAFKLRAKYMKIENSGQYIGQSEVNNCALIFFQKVKSKYFKNTLLRPQMLECMRPTYLDFATYEMGNTEDGQEEV